MEIFYDSSKKKDGRVARKIEISGMKAKTVLPEKPHGAIWVNFYPNWAVRYPIWGLMTQFNNFNKAECPVRFEINLAPQKIFSVGKTFFYRLFGIKIGVRQGVDSIFDAVWHQVCKEVKKMPECAFFLNRTFGINTLKFSGLSKQAGAFFPNRIIIAQESERKNQCSQTAPTTP